MDEKGQSRKVSTGYPGFQMARALLTLENHDDPQVRQSARAKVEKWQAVIEGMLQGTLDVGSRTPVAGTPPWVTLEVITGGFATGRFAAEGELRPHEKTLLADLGVPEAHGRKAIDSYFLSDPGIADLQQRLASGCYAIEVPEEGALLVAAWLLNHGEPGLAREIVERIAQYLDRLRFYPAPAERSLHHGAHVFAATVGETIASLGAMRENPQIVAQKKAAELWAPMYDEVVQLFLETVQGGWPCARYPDGWRERAAAVVRAYDVAIQSGGSRRARRPKGHFYRLLQYLRSVLRDPASLGGRDVGRIRRMLSDYVQKRGEPNSQECRLNRMEQLRQASAPSHFALSRVMMTRFSLLPRDEGLDDPEALAGPVTEDEQRSHNVSRGAVMPQSVLRRLRRCLWDRVEVLVERGIVTSGETIARLLPQITGSLRAMGFDDAELGRLYASIYRAFRRRRSLLLLNLESQVRLEELPWVQPLERFRRKDEAVDLSRRSLQEIVSLALSSFPQAILPNKLLREVSALAKDAKLQLPLLEELAADIFMGRFSDKYMEAARTAASLLKGTLYERYYQVDYAAIECWPKDWRITGNGLQKSATLHFDQLCITRAGVQPGSVVSNGMIIEQQQILTTQNLAVLFAAAAIRESLADRLGPMARACFEWICRRLQVKCSGHARLIALKNSAYAWRQMLFYLSLAGEGEATEFLPWADGCLEKQPPAFREKFAPAWRGLLAVARGQTWPQDGTARPFLAWSPGHWMY